MNEILGEEDLRHVFIEVPTVWRTVSCADATDEQFDAWAESQMQVLRDRPSWPAEKRARFCNLLNQYGVLSKDR